MKGGTATLFGVRKRENHPLQSPSTPDVHSQGLILFAHSFIPSILVSLFPLCSVEAEIPMEDQVVCEKSTPGQGDLSQDRSLTVVKATCAVV